MSKIYTGIGARDTPKEILDVMYDIGVDLGDWGYVLRSGAAEGADAAFEEGCDFVRGQKEIYLPWPGFNNSDSPRVGTGPNTEKIAEKIYGARWNSISSAVQKLMARDIPQVSGLNLDLPSDFVVCWTPDGCRTKSDRTKQTGGTGQAIAYADTLSVPVFNLYNKDEHTRLMKFIDTIGVMKW